MKKLIYIFIPLEFKLQKIFLYSYLQIMMIYEKSKFG